MEDVQFRVFYPDRIDLNEFVRQVNYRDATDFSLKGELTVALAAPMFNRPRERVYVFDLKSRTFSLPEAPKNIIRGLTGTIIDEVLCMKLGENASVLEVIPVVSDVTLSKAANLLLPLYDGFVYSADYPVVGSFDKRQDGFMACLTGSASHREKIERQLDAKFSGRFALSVEYGIPKSLSSFK